MSMWCSSCKHDSSNEEDEKWCDDCNVRNDNYNTSFNYEEVEEKSITTLKLIEEVETLDANTPDGLIRDSDTILTDLLEECDFEFSGFAHDIFTIWKDSTDKEAVEQMFYEFTGMEFVNYLNKCKAEITR